jgi:RNA polymerase sigma-70 factor, ECF subfamily
MHQVFEGVRMADTSATLLERLRQPGDNSAWKTLLEIYTPLLTGWLRRYALQASDVDDLVQEVLAVVVRELPRFEHNQQSGAFRSWLRSILVNRLREYWRSRRYRPSAGGSDVEAMLEQLAKPDSDLSRLFDREHDQHVARRLLQLTEPQFTSSTWQAFRRHVLEGVPAEQVAAEVGTTVNAVCIAKSRVLQRLRRESRELLG